MTTIQFADYVFPNIQTTSPHFADVVQSAVRLPGTDGGFDNYGNERAPLAVGAPSLTFTLNAQPDPDTMYSKLDDVLRLQNMGEQMLRYTPRGASKARWCYAKISNITVPLQPSSGVASHFLLVAVTFQVDEPFWYEALDGTFIFGESLIGTGVLGGGSSQVVTGSDEIDISRVGTADTLPRISIKADQSTPVAAPYLEVIDAAGNRDSWIWWQDGLASGDLLVIDCRKRTVLLNGADAYDALDYDRGYWLKFPTGNITLKVLFGTASHAATVAVSYWEAYY